jgi:uncharacterized membrane protein
LYFGFGRQDCIGKLSIFMENIVGLVVIVAFPFAAHHTLIVVGVRWIKSFF